MSLEPHDIKRAITPLRLVFWGGIVCVFDFRFNGFDILNDILGAILITCGVFGLANLSVNGPYRRAMLFVKIASLLAIAQAIYAHLDVETPRPVVLLLHLYGIVKMLATVVFCMAMRQLCIAAGLTKSEQSWKTTTILFAVIYLVPWSLLHCVWIICLITGATFNFRLGPEVLLILFVFLIPLVHLFISTSRMRREAESVSTPQKQWQPQPPFADSTPGGI